MPGLTKPEGLRNTLLGTGILAFLLLQKHSGFMIIFLWLVLLPWLMYSVWISVTRPAARALQLKKIAVWSVLSLVVVAYHAQLHYRTRAEAQTIVDAVHKYIEVNRRCPEELSQIEIPDGKLRQVIGDSGYHCEGGKATLFYASTYIAFEVDSYDFKTKAWVHRN